jgi:hypothetical protein
MFEIEKLKKLDATTFDLITSALVDQSYSSTSIIPFVFSIPPLPSFCAIALILGHYNSSRSQFSNFPMVVVFLNLP